MKPRFSALLALAPLLLLPVGATGTSPDSFPFDVSPDLSKADLAPDGVALWDLSQVSTVWGRVIDFEPPEGVAETDIFSVCEFTGSVAAQWECLTPYVKDVRWEIHTGEAPTAPRGFGLPELPGIGIGTVTDVTITFDVDDFVIYDNVDCCNNANAEGYVVFSAWRSGAYVQNSAQFCETQSASSGNCHASWTTTFTVTSVGPNSCSGIQGRVEFRDDDGSVDDTMDISSRNNDGVADIQAVLPAGSSPCNNEDNQWWSERDNTDSPSGDRCHAIAVFAYCELTGDGDSAGDNDDAGIEFTMF